MGTGDSVYFYANFGQICNYFKTKRLKKLNFSWGGGRGGTTNREGVCQTRRKQRTPVRPGVGPHTGARARSSLPAQPPRVGRGGGARGRLWLTPCVTAASTTTLGRWGARPSLPFYETPGGWSLNTERPSVCQGSLLSAPVFRDRTEEAADGRLPPQGGKTTGGMPGGLRPQRAGRPEGPGPLQEAPVSILALSGLETVTPGTGAGMSPTTPRTAPRPPQPTRACDLEHAGPAHPGGTYTCICLSH